MAETPHTARAHARLAPSAAHRWSECPGSVRLCEAMPSTASSYANEGTAAHELAAHCLRMVIAPHLFLGRVIDIDDPNDRFKTDGADGVRRFTVDDEMVDSVATYIDAVRSVMPREQQCTLEVEQRLNMQHLHPDIFGTGDAVVFVPHASHLHVFDLKYGKGVVVEAEGNDQLMLYAAGAARRYSASIDAISMHIVQPRAPHVRGPVRSCRVDLLDLYEFENRLEALAKATEAPGAPLVAGDHCRFCAAAPICPALRERSRAVALSEFGDMTAPSALSPEEIAAVLREAETIGNWVKAVQDYAHGEAMAGRVPPGFKLVDKRATRRWRDPQDVIDRLTVEVGLRTDEIMTEPELKSPAKVEQLLGKKGFASVADLVVKQSSGFNLVPASDPRPTVTVVEATAEFGDATILEAAE